MKITAQGWVYSTLYTELHGLFKEFSRVILTKFFLCMYRLHACPLCDYYMHVLLKFVGFFLCFLFFFVFSVRNVLRGFSVSVHKDIPSDRCAIIKTVSNFFLL